MLDEKKLTLEDIEDTYHNKTQRYFTTAERLMIRVWLRGIRQRIKGGLPRFDEPFGNGLSRLPESVPMGPGRTMPFTTFVRQVLERPGAQMPVYTKVAPNYHQERRKWAQVDGSVSDLHIRSALAALAAGATIHNLALDEIHNFLRI